jgi:demethylmenaquinone methyltransferase / 2-methoxy-6-polyprenyl-1,4-benzoquinol methylase
MDQMRDQLRPADVLPPHPVLHDYYASAETRPRFVRRLFDTTAPDYDGINALFSLGTGARYRAQVMRRSGIGAGARVIDVATGTGLLAAAALALVGPEGRVLGVDVSAGMLRVAQRRPGLLLAQGRAEALPVADRGFEFLTMGYALRHVAGLEGAFREFGRVLAPGGRLVLLEIGRPETTLGMTLARLYLGRLIPALARLGGSGGQARMLMRYYWDTIEACVPPATILRALEAAGFAEAACRTEFGMFKTYTAMRPRAAVG